MGDDQPPLSDPLRRVVAGAVQLDVIGATKALHRCILSLHMVKAGTDVRWHRQCFRALTLEIRD